MNERREQEVKVTVMDEAPVLPSKWSQWWSRFRASPILTPKIVGLVPARNEAARIGFCLRALSKYTDAIVFLDDCSDDDTVEVVKSLAEECSVEEVICKSSWYRDEPGDRNALLAAGRRIGGTHFMVIDADEAFTANCMDGDYLRGQILSLKPREQLSLHWIQLWRSVREYRTGDSVWSNRYKRCIFCDDGHSVYRSNFIHTSRIPKMKGRRIKLESELGGLLHFQFVNWDNLILKHKWYRWLERVRDPDKPIEKINAKYAKSLDEAHLALSPLPDNWLVGYSELELSDFDVSDQWRIHQLEQWQEEFGKAYFQGLDD